MNILFTICGRAGSKGIKNKNLKPLYGYPLPYYTLSVIELYVKRHPEIVFDAVVNSDSKDLLGLLESNRMIPVEKIERDLSLGGTLSVRLQLFKIAWIRWRNVNVSNMIWLLILILHHHFGL